MTGAAYATSAEMAALHGRLPRLRRQPRRHAAGHPQPPPRRPWRDGAATKASPSCRSRSTRANCPDAPLVAAAKRAWDRALALGEPHGFRNAQVSVIAPTGTIGLVMDCDTTGIEPDFSLVKFKKLAGGGYFKIINQTVPRRSATLGYDEAAIARIVRYAVGHGSLAEAPAINHETLAARGFDRRDDRAGREVDRHRLRHPLRLLALHAGRSVLPRGPRPRRQAARRSQARRAGAPRLLEERHRGGERARVRDDDASRARPISRPSISRCSIVRIPVDEMARAACLRRVTYA